VGLLLTSRTWSSGHLRRLGGPTDSFGGTEFPDTQARRATAALTTVASEDDGVPPENSILFYEALQKAKVPAELHIFNKGTHGLGLGPKGMGLSAWPRLCAAWMEEMGFLRKAH
jgi:acetyl esterase/lipase